MAGKDLFTDEDHFITVTMDGGVYRWLTEIIEAKSRQRTYNWIDWQKKLVDRAKEQFAAAGNDSPPG